MTRAATVPRALFEKLQSRPTALPAARGKLDRKVTARMNKGEQRYSLVLDQRIAAGTITAWWFEFITIRLADNTHYRPDFLVMLPDGALEIHEVKGRKGESFYAEEDAWLKVKIVAEVSPIPIRVVWPSTDGGWNERAL